MRMTGSARRWPLLMRTGLTPFAGLPDLVTGRTSRSYPTAPYTCAIFSNPGSTLPLSIFASSGGDIPAEAAASRCVNPHRLRSSINCRAISYSGASRSNASLNPELPSSLSNQCRQPTLGDTFRTRLTRVTSRRFALASPCRTTNLCPRATEQSIRLSLPTARISQMPWPTGATCGLPTSGPYSTVHFTMLLPSEVARRD